MEKATQVAEAGFGWVWQQPTYSPLTLEYWHGWMMWAILHNHAILLGVIILLLLIQNRVLRKQRTQERSWWRGRMEQLFGGMPKLTKKQEKAYLDQLQEDVLVEGLEAAVYEGKISREQAKHIYMHQATYAGLKGLLPRTDQVKLKRELHAPESGLFEHFMSVVLPRVEARLSELQKGEIQRRLVLGRSMGGFNGAVIALQNPKLFAKVALLCPAIIPFNPYAAKKVVDDYILRNQLDSQLVFDWLVEFPKAFFDNTKSARAFYPLAHLKRGGQLGPTEFFLAVGNADQFGFMEGARLFSDLVAKKGGAVRYQQLLAATAPLTLRTLRPRPARRCRCADA